MDDIVGIRETKVDTLIRKELERLKSNEQTLQQTSSAEKVQKKSGKTQEERALPPPSGKRSEEITEIAGTYY